MNSRLRRSFWYRQIPFLLLFILAIGVRFIQIENRPWDSDELGALFRAENALDFNSHLENGVAIDGHPALVQTFLWTNSQTWKLNPTQLKYLWAFTSLLSIVLFYGFYWSRFGRKSAFFVASGLCLLWWPVSLSIWVRPYTIALFWMGLLAVSSEKQFKQKNTATIWIVLMAISMALLAYSHYMAALTGSIFLLSEWVQKKITIRYLILVGVLASLLYVPHIGLFLTQLNEGGLTWLGKPSFTFIWDQIFYVLNQSNLVAFWLVIMLFAGGFTLYKKGFPKKLWMKSISLLGIWIGVFLISFAYSHLQKPVLQHNALYFALPFLLGGISVVFLKIPVPLLRFLNFIWVSILFFSLTNEKSHFGTSMEDRYKTPLKIISEFEKQTHNNYPCFIDGPSDLMRFHLKTSPINNPILLEDTNSIHLYGKLNQIDSNHSFDTVWIALNSGSDVNLQTYFWSRFRPIPVLNSKRKRNFITGGEFYCAEYSDSSLLFTTRYIERQADANELLFIDFNEIESKLGKINTNDFLVISVYDGFDCNEVFRNFDLVSALFQEGFNKTLNQIDYRFTANSQIANRHNGWLNHTIKLADIPSWNQNSRLRISYEYRGEDSNFIRKNIQFRIRKIEGNPNMYERVTTQFLKF